MTHSQRTCITVREAAPHAIVIAHKEDTRELRGFLATEGFVVSEVRGPYPAGSEDWSPSMRCLWNHMNAWKRAIAGDQTTLVVEADFVPVRRLSSLPLPAGPGSLQAGLMYLYACGPQVYDLRGGLRGHAGGTVAYVASLPVLGLLVEYGETTLRSRDPRAYWGWDAALGFWLQERGIDSYVGLRQYGEHGGEPNREHALAGLRGWHRADVLWDSLPWLPAYAHGNRMRYLWLRAKARALGMARLLAGRFLAAHDLRRSDEKLRLLGLAMGRHWRSKAWCRDKTDQLARGPGCAP